jgi:hypothetical protein
MFLDEARIGAQLNHPNIVHVYAPATTDTNKKDATTKGSSNDGAQETAGDGSEQTSGDDVLETSGEGAEAEYIEILE